MDSFVARLLAASLFFAIFIALRIKFRPRRLPLPPGPKGLPLVGNVLDMPKEQEWLTFAKWGEKWGDICSITILGRTVIILNSPETATDMLDKKSSIYSDRPILQMGGELVGWKNTMALLPYGERFRNHRRSFHRTIGTRSSVTQFHSPQELETRKFLSRVLVNPGELSSHIRQAVGSVTLRITHGYETREANDPFIELADKATKQFSLATAPGGWMVDFIPWLRHVPDWVPGTEFKQKAKAWSCTLNAMVDQPFEFVRKQMVAGVAPSSFTSLLLESKQPLPEAENDIKWISASLYSGAADTTVSAIYAFFLAMVLHPDVASKAQQEIEAVVGTERLPNFADREHLPYVSALAKEVLRWNSVAPLALPHVATQDDVHEGYFIPKGSFVMPNLWGMTHDPRRYRDPTVFNPERFIPSEGRHVEPDPYDVVFGFGRRICPGSHLADATIFITCAMSLAVFNISKAVENGVTIEPVHDNTTGTISRPKPFKCSISPRSGKALSLIQSGEQE
ncbi:cytochrome P450 [Pleurotus eryngii]|uniref:Cytochrome P450 n=1 Tax=Pleurotus eryngii TaxID=5323 RepID=A0A9P6D9Y6_PLEER|nr:cytochrome P450 [Pleurotus eryngii]